MTDNTTIPERAGRGFMALAACVAVGLFIGIMCGLSLARRLVPAPTESRLVMQLLALEHATLSARAQGGQCEPLSPARARVVLALVELVPVSMRDTLVVDARFERKVERLRHAVQRLAVNTSPGCKEHTRLLAAVDSACRDCHLEYRSGDSK